MKIRASVAVRLVLIGFFLAVAWSLQDRVADAGQGLEETFGLYALTIAP